MATNIDHLPYLGSDEQTGACWCGATLEAHNQPIFSLAALVIIKAVPDSLGTPEAEPSD